MTLAGDVYPQEAADTVMTLMLLLARQVGEGGDAGISWSLAGKCLGLVGLDSVGQLVARRASMGFGMRVMIHTETVVDRPIAAKVGVEWTPSIDHVLRTSDVVSLHGRPGDRARTITAERLNQMECDALLINGSHGELMDETAVVHALWFETIGGVGLSAPTRTLSRLRDFEASDKATILDHPVKKAITEVRHPALSMPDNVVDFSMAACRRA
ncbi:MAG: NAD(P)-dependent oxidoreductase [Pseudomonadota bacterium]